MKNFVHFCLVPFWMFTVSLNAFSSDTMEYNNVGTLTKIEGDVQIFSNPGKTMQGPPPHALFEGEYYSVVQAGPGAKVENGNIVRTAPRAQTQIIFENGDQIYVGPSTSYRVFWNDAEHAKANSPQTYMQLLYGKLRNVVSRTGPRNNMKIKAGNAVMGVRGTDFFVSKSGASDAFEISTLRGKVAIEDIAGKHPTKKDLIVVTPGFSAHLDESTLSSPAKVSKDVLKKTSKEELEVINRVATVQETKKIEDPEIQKKIAALETKAVQTTVKDVEHYHPEEAKSLKKNKDLSIETVNETTVEVLAKTAPQEKVKPKPHREDLELDQDSYQRYFKNVKE